MNLNWLIRRNRFKNRTKSEKPGWQWPAFVVEWRRYARRAAIVALTCGVLGALAWALDRPVQVISIDGSFQRVSPGQIEQALAPYAHAGFMSATSIKSSSPWRRCRGSCTRASSAAGRTACTSP